MFNNKIFYLMKPKALFMLQNDPLYDMEVIRTELQLISVKVIQLESVHNSQCLLNTNINLSMCGIYPISYTKNIACLGFKMNFLKQKNNIALNSVHFMANINRCNNDNNDTSVLEINW